MSLTWRRLCRTTAALLVDGAGDSAALHARVATGLGVDPRRRWLLAVVERVATAFPPGSRRPLRSALTIFLTADAGFRRAWREYHIGPTILPPPAAMRPMAGPPAAWDVPAWTSARALAADLGCDPADLPWLAGGHPSRPLPRDARHHYRYRWVAKRSGGERLIEEPLPRLKRIQRTLLTRLLARIPAHPAAHGFVAGRSVRSFAAPHRDRYVVVRLDLADFFPGIRGPRILGLFLAAGYPEAVARLVTGLCTNRVPGSVLVGHDVSRDRFTDWHLPQGAPTSPALANVCAWRLDCRLAGLARGAGAAYTRYADDLVFSGGREFAVHLQRFLIRAEAIVLSEGFRLNPRKTRVRRRAAQQLVGGLVVNAGLHCPRHERERLEAILVNCVRHGPAEQNREGHVDFRAHLAGRIAWVAQQHPALGARLAGLLGQIAWPTGSAPGHTPPAPPG